MIWTVAAREQHVPNTGAKLVLLTLSTYADQDGRAWPALDRLAADVGLSDRQVRTYLRQLEEWGMVAQIRAGNRHGPSVYELTFNRKSELPPSECFQPEVLLPPSNGLSRNPGLPPSNGSQAEAILPASGASRRKFGVVLGGSPRARVSENPNELPSSNISSPSETLPSPSVNGSGSKWDAPDWFHPLTELPGYRHADHSRSAATIEMACRAAGVDPNVVVGRFCAYWPEGQIAHGWIDPVAALNRSRNVQISKVVNDGRNGRSRSHATAGQGGGGRGPAPQRRGGGWE